MNAIALVNRNEQRKIGHVKTYEALCIGSFTFQKYYLFLVFYFLKPRGGKPMLGSC
jgi:hypothetical protein